MRIRDKAKQREYDQKRRLLNPPPNGSFQARLELFELRTVAYTAAEWAYAAGLVDGEGTIVLRLTGNKIDRLHSVHIQANVSIANTDKDMIDWLTEKFGGYVIWQRGWDHANGKRVRPVARWQLNGRVAASFCRQIGPYLRTPKRERARLVVELFNRPIEMQWAGGHRLPPDEVQRRRALLEEYANIGLV